MRYALLGDIHGNTEALDVIASTPDQFTAQIKAEVAKWTKVVKDAGVKVE